MEKKKIIRLIFIYLIFIISYAYTFYNIFYQFNFINLLIAISVLYISIHYIVIESGNKITASSFLFFLIANIIEIILLEKNLLTIWTILFYNIGVITLVYNTNKELFSRINFQPSSFFNVWKWLFILFCALAIWINIINKNNYINVSCKNLYTAISKTIDFVPTNEKISDNDKIEIKKLVIQWLTLTVKWWLEAWIDYSIKTSWFEDQFSSSSKPTTNKQKTISTTQNKIFTWEGLKQQVNNEIKKEIDNNQDLQNIMNKYNLDEKQLWLDKIIDNATNQAQENIEKTNTNQINPKISTGTKTNIKDNIWTQNNNIAGLLDKDFIKQQITKSIWLNPKIENQKICSLITDSIEDIYKIPFVRYYSMILVSIFFIIVLKIIFYWVSFINIVLFNFFKLTKIYKIETQTQKVDKII